MRMPARGDRPALAELVRLQKRLAWDLEQSIHWSSGIDLDRYFVPLDQESIAFPDSTPDQRLALSQYMGLVIAQTIAEMELALILAKESVWKERLERHPASCEFESLGEQLFDEELKHARMFKRYVAMFAERTGVTEPELQQILPAVQGSASYSALLAHASLGGHALWWVLTLVEEVSMSIFRQLQPFKDRIDPLYYQIHQRHFEEEARHCSYGYLMLEHLYEGGASSTRFFRKTDAAVAQAAITSWCIASLFNIRHARNFRTRHAFYERLSSCIPLVFRKSPVRTFQRFFSHAPYISLLLNPTAHSNYQALAARLGVFQIPVPQFRPAPLSV